MCLYVRADNGCNRAVKGLNRAVKVVNRADKGGFSVLVCSGAWSPVWDSIFQCTVRLTSESVRLAVLVVRLIA